MANCVKNIKWCHRPQHLWHFSRRVKSTLSIMHHQEIMGRGHDVTKTRQCLRCLLTVGNFQNVNLLMDAKKYLTSLTVIQDCATPWNRKQIVFEMQLFHNLEGEVFFARMHRSNLWGDQGTSWFLQNLQSRWLKNSVRGQDSIFSRTRKALEFIHTWEPFEITRVVEGMPKSLRASSSNWTEQLKQSLLPIWMN